MLTTIGLGFAMDVAIEWLQIAKAKIFYSVPDASFIGGLALWMLPTVVFAVLAVLITHVVSVDAIGSGIPQMKTILSGVHLRGTFP